MDCENCKKLREENEELKKDLEAYKAAFADFEQAALTDHIAQKRLRRER